MMVMEQVLDDKDVALLHATQNGIPLVEEPFRDIADALQMSAEDVILRLRKMRDAGVIRRFGASIDNRKVGISANAMVCWNVPGNRVEEVGETFAQNDRVTHCYLRKTIPGRWRHNLFTVLHGHDHATVERLVKEMSITSGIKDYAILFSTREFKKTNNGRIDKDAIASVTARGAIND